MDRIAVRVAAEAAADLDDEAFIRIFQAWIRRRALPAILIDVADYRHVVRGPGVLLVAHEANYCMDRGAGEIGLVYQRKRALDGAPADRVRACLREALRACLLLEEEAEVAGRLSFRADRIVVVSNDRLRAPNDEASFEAWRPAVEAAVTGLYDAPATVRRRSNDPRERLAIEVVGPGPASARKVLERLE